MATIHGELLELGIAEDWRRTFEGDAVAVQGGEAIASGRIDRFGRFAIELPTETVGQIEVRVSIHGAAPLTIEVNDGDDEVPARIVVNRFQGHAY